MKTSTTTSHRCDAVVPPVPCNPKPRQQKRRTNKKKLEIEISDGTPELNIASAFTLVLPIYAIYSAAWNHKTFNLLLEIMSIFRNVAAFHVSSPLHSNWQPDYFNKVKTNCHCETLPFWQKLATINLRFRNVLFYYFYFRFVVQNEFPWNVFGVYVIISYFHFISFRRSLKLVLSFCFIIDLDFHSRLLQLNGCVQFLWSTFRFMMKHVPFLLSSIQLQRRRFMIAD